MSGPRERVSKRHLRVMQLARLGVGDGGKERREMHRLKAVGPLLVSYVQTAAESGCPAAKRIMQQWCDALPAD